MGYELNRLMQQYGVSTPVLSYSGMQKPVKPVDLAATASTTDRANYDALLAKYNADLPLYQSDQAKYKTYSDDYKNRLATTSMYDAPQFQRGAMSSPGTGMFTDQYSQMYQDVLGRAPDPAGLAYWKSKFGDTISSDEYSEFMQSAQREMGSRPPTNLPVSTARTVLNQPTYSTPTQAPILQTAANNPVTNATVGEPPAGGENPAATTPDWGTALSIGQTLSNMGLTTIGDHLQSEGRMGINAQTGAYSQTAQDQRAAEAAAMAAQVANAASVNTGLPSSFVGPSDQEGMTLNPNPTAPMVAIGTPVSRNLSDTATALSTNLSSGIPSSVVSDAFTNAMTGATTYSNAAIADAIANAMSGGDTSGSSEGGGYGGPGGAYSGGSSDPSLNAKGGYIKGYANGGAVDSRLYGETDEVATGPGYSVPPIDPRLQSLASKYQQPGFQPSFASGSIDPGQSQMDMIREDALQNGLGAPVINISADKPAMSSNMAALQQMLRATQYQASPYADDLRAARAAAKSQTIAFNKMLQDAIKGQEDSGPSKAETYFRLAAAFGAPTKTGNFAESLAEVNKSMAEQAKETRLSNKAGQALKLQLGLEGAKAGMATAREDVNALRALTGEEMKEKASAQRELIKDYFTSGKAQSSAGKQAIDEGLVQGSPEFQSRVKTISDEEFKKLTAGVDASVAAANASVAAMTRGDETARLAREKFELQQKNAAKLTVPEMKLKTDTEDMIGQTDQAMASLRRAFALNPKTFDNSLPDLAQRKILEAAGSKDEKVIATREMENILEKAALSALKATFPGAISDGERKALLNVQGLGAKSIEERAKIMMSGYEALKSVAERSKTRLKRINEGGYRDTIPSITGEIE